MPHPEPLATVELGEYELQVLRTITQHAIDDGAISHELYGVVTSVQKKCEAARTELAIQRRRLAVQQASDGTAGKATTSNERESDNA